ncbi:MAG: nucleoside hydrolase-like domain-containing protein, partial [Peristeroidobacter soli]
MAERAWRFVLGLMFVAALFAPALRVEAQALAADYVDRFEGKPRLFVLTDIGNEPDDQMSLVRLLVYSNEFELEGLVATTSTWQKEKVQPETIHQV